MAGHTLVSFALELSVYARMCVHVRTFDRPQFCSEIVRCYHPFPGGGGYGGMGVGSAPQAFVHCVPVQRRLTMESGAP